MPDEESRRTHLGDGLVLRAVRDEGDGERFAAFHTACNNPHEGATCACLLRHHPETTRQDYWLVEDTRTGQIASTTCLIPWRCRYAGLELRVAMLEMVLTHPAYRRRELVRAQVQHFLRQVQERAYDLSIIWGIPFYYRQYGYTYAIDGEVYESLPTWRVLTPPAGVDATCRLRPATPADIPYLDGLYQTSNAGLDLWVLRGPAYWRYLLGAAHYPVALVEQASTGQALGYAAIAPTPDGLHVLESGFASAAAGLAFLQALAAPARLFDVTQEGKPAAPAGREMRVSWPESNLLAQLARSLGSQTVSGGQWLLRIPDIARFLTRLGPVLASRLADSAWRGLTRQLVINLYRQAYRLRFVAGELAAVEPLGFVDASMGADGGDACLPPGAFTRLACGYRQLDELRDAWPDIVVKPEVRHLLGVLFPPLKAYLLTPYHAMEPLPGD
jgi:hypothetical protein